MPQAEKDRLRREKHERRRIERRQKRAAAREALPGVPNDAGPFFSRDGKPLAINDLYLGGSCFIVLSGPSILSLDLAPLGRRGVFTIGCNNSPAIWRPNFWLCYDQGQKFHHSIWTDPHIIKSVPLKKLNRWHVQKRGDDGQLRPVTQADHSGGVRHLHPKDLPSVIGHRRNGNFRPDVWLSEPSINCGNGKGNAAQNGFPSLNNVFFAVVKHAYALGFRVVYLLGCDFKMDAQRPYAFAQAKSHGAAAGCNSAFDKMNRMFAELQPRFKAAGFYVFNCYERSGLTAFPYVPFGEAIDAASGHVEQDPLNTAGHYEIGDKSKRKP